MEQFETNEEFIYSLIIEDLDGGISASDKLLLDNWRKADGENERTYLDFRNIQLGLDLLYAHPPVDADMSWKELEEKIDAEEKIELKPARSSRLWFQIAAAVLLLLSAGYYFSPGNSYTLVSTEDNASITHVVLPDGTDLNLNASTTIRYHKTNFNEDRSLELLKGEVFIKVKNHDNPAQFKVKIGEVEARDIGTSFNVRKTDDQVAVIVEEGQVALSHAASGKEVMLTPGKLGMYNQNNKALSTLNNANLNYKAWIDRKFIFTEVAVQEVVDQVGEVYQIPIRILGNGLKERKLTARLHYQTLDSALAVISASLQCKITREKDAYVLSDK